MRGFGPEELLTCYARGVFPMADGKHDPRIFLLEPDERGIIPLDGFHVPRRLARTARQDVFEVRVDTAFAHVLDACAETGSGREETWINEPIRRLYIELFRRGSAHSVECWQNDTLVGGLYGVALGGAFFGESMFSHARDASKIALVHLVARLIEGGFTLLDTQFLTEHLAQFGAELVTQADYRDRLDAALLINGDFLKMPETTSGRQSLQSITQTS
tara:strand:- start:480 stop:1130 length:651 start_codon:yes stop_codon:yes gene_type:complete